MVEKLGWQYDVIILMVILFFKETIKNITIHWFVEQAPDVDPALRTKWKKGAFVQFFFSYIILFCFFRYHKLRLKKDDHIVVYEDLSGEVRFSKHLPQPNNLSRWLNPQWHTACLSPFIWPTNPNNVIIM